MPAPSTMRVYGALAAAVLGVSLAAIFVRLADAPGVVVALYRMAIASLLLLPWTVRGLRTTPPSRSALCYAVVAGVLLAAHFATWLTSLFYTSVAASVALVTTNPLWIALFSWLFLRLRPSRAVLVGALAGVAGSVMIGLGDASGGEGSRPLLGDALALAGAVFVSGYLLLGRSAQRRGLGLDAYAGIAYAVAAIALLPLPALLGFPYGPWPLSTWGWLLLLALVPQIVGHTGLNYAVKHLDPVFVMTVALLEPFLAGLLAFVIFGEVPAPLTLAGAALLLCGVGIAARYGRRRNDEAGGGDMVGAASSKAVGSSIPGSR